MRNLMRLRIRADQVAGYSARVWLNDVEIYGVRAVSLEMSYDAANEARITFTPGEVDVDAESVAVLQAIVERQKAVT